MEKYEIVEHTGDVKIKVYGNTKEELFRNALEGMFYILNPRLRQGFGGQSKIQRSIKVNSPDVNALLVDFLNEVNYLRQVNREAYDKVNFKKFSDTELEAELDGSKVQEFGEDIKAVTFHSLDIRQNEKGQWETAIVFDV